MRHKNIKMINTTIKAMLMHMKRRKAKQRKWEIQLSASVWPQGIHAIILLDLIHLQKSLAGCKSSIHRGLRPWKSFFPRNLSHRQRAAASLLYVRITALNLHVGQRHPGWKQTLIMNEYIRLLYLDCPFMQAVRERTGWHTVVRTGNSSNIWGKPRRACINVFFLRTATQWSMNWTLS